VNGTLRNGIGGGAGRSLLYYMAVGCISVFLCRVRRRNAFAKWLVSQRLAVLTERRANFLHCLMPYKVFRSQMSAPPAVQDKHVLVKPLDDILVMFYSLPD
jgi:hypothetical protein